MQEIALTLFLGKHSIAPESSDGFASVGTILPKEKAALLPGGFFAFAAHNFSLAGVAFLRPFCSVLCFQPLPFLTRR
jgi:hypothetical protein